jgi:hypothetical protein
VVAALVATSTSGTTDAQGTSRTCPVPTGAAAGHVAVLELEMWQSTAVNPTITWPSGFTEIVNYVSTTDGFQKVKAALKVLSAADTGNYSMSWTGTHFQQAQCSLWSGIDNTTPLDVAVNLAQNSTGTAYPSNSLTTANAGDGMIHMVANENTCTSLPPTGYTEQQEANYLKTNTKVAGSAGSESISGGSVSASTLKLGALIALRAAAGGGNSATPGVATETDAAQPAGRIRATPVGVALETDTAQPAGSNRITTAGVAAETDTAQPAGRVRVTTAVVALETDTALGASSPGGHSAAAGTALETDAAQPAGRSRVTAAGTALEVDAALSAARTRASSPGTAVETDTAQTAGRTRVTLVGTALEVDQAQAAGNPNEILRDLRWSTYVEPDRWECSVEPDRWVSAVEADRWTTEVETV